MKLIDKKHIVYKPINRNNSNKDVNTQQPPPQTPSFTEGSKENQGKMGSRGQLVDKLNYINFQEGTILANFKHKTDNHSISRSIIPQLCHESRLDCLWVESAGIHQILRSYDFQNLFISDEQNLLLVNPELINISKQEVSFKLPNTYSKISNRKVKRYTCSKINVQMTQDSAFYDGKLIEFSPLAFGVKIPDTQSRTFQWVNPKSKVNIVLFSENEPLYSGVCKIIRQVNNKGTSTCVLKPVNDHIQRFEPKELRSTRHALVPSPDIHFKHPFTEEIITRKVVNISGSGFAAEETEKNSVLLPGMTIPDLNLCLAGGFKLKCKGLVVYRKRSQNKSNENHVICGITILDMDLNDHMKLLAIINQIENENSYLDNKVDIDALWRFFFKSGLINQKNYSLIKTNKKKIKETYENLYDRKPDLARHFIYQTNGKIKGHMSLLRFYENSWLIHNQAAGSPLVQARLGVLNQTARFAYESHRLSSIHMNYVINYYNQDNKFNRLVFNGAAQRISDSNGCSLDPFAYFHYRRSYYDKPMLSAPWNIAISSHEDLIELENFYHTESNGLMIQALDLQPDTISSSELSQKYKELGLKRNTYILSLKKYNTVKAIIIINISDVCLNVSDMTSCIKVIVMDQEDLPKETLHRMLSQILGKIKQNEMPILLYPTQFAKNQNIAVEKFYNLWVLNALYADQFINHLNTLVKP